MGVMTFLLPDGISAEARRELERAAIAGGPDNMPMPTDVSIGSGQLRTVSRTPFGQMARAVVCDACAGGGKNARDPCRECRGRGRVARRRKLKIDVPEGIEDGQRIRLSGRGHVGERGGPPGDLYVLVHVAPHELFGRRGDDLTITVPITFAEAALGAEVKVPTLAEPVTLKVPAGTPSGRTLRVRGRGVAKSKGAGDLLVTVEVAVPKSLTAAQREAVEALAAAFPESPRGHLGV